MNDNQPHIPSDLAQLLMDICTNNMETAVYEERLKQFKNLSPYRITSEVPVSSK